jgi:putative transposase
VIFSGTETRPFRVFKNYTLLQQLVEFQKRFRLLGLPLAEIRWKEFLLGLKSRGLRGVLFAVSDDHPGLKSAIAQVLAEAFWQRCYVHFLCNEETFTFYRLPKEHHKHLKSTNVLERLNQELKRRTQVIRIFQLTRSRRQASELSSLPLPGSSNT